MRAVLYARVSDPRQAEDDRASLPAQRAEFLRHCAELGYEPSPRIYTDIMPGVRADRPDYQQMLADAHAGLFQRIIVRDPTRFGRDEKRAIRDMLDVELEAGVTVEFIFGRHRSLSDVVEDFEDGAKERRRLSNRLTATMVYKRREEGKILGRCPYGYRKVAGELVVEPFEASVVRRIFRMYARNEGGSPHIARVLNEGGIPPQRAEEWSQPIISRMLKNRTYIGESHWSSHDEHGDPISGWLPCPALVSVPEFDQVQEMAARRAEIVAPRGQGSGYLLSGLIYCGECGARMKGWKGNRYRCADDRAHACRPTWSVRCDEVDESVIAKLSEGLSAVRDVEDDALARAEQAQHAVSAAEDRLSAAQKRVDRALDLWTDGRLSDAEWDRQRGRLEAGVEAAQHEVDAAKVSYLHEQARASQSAAIVSRIHTFMEVMHSEPLPIAKVHLQTIVEKVEVYTSPARAEVTLL